MYLDLLSAGNNGFETAINRSFPRFRSSRLSAVVTALQRVQASPIQLNMANLMHALHTWRTQDPNEWANRGGTNGVAYRLWMETKQRLRNATGYLPYPNDPLLPGGCLGTTLLGTYVPPAPEGVGEICHGFTYRWLVARGKLPETRPALGAGWNGVVMAPVLFPNGVNTYAAARAGGVLQVQAGDLVGFYDPNTLLLQHTVIVEGQNLWFGANNAGTFQKPIGRTQVNLNAVPMGYAWIDGGNQWQTPLGTCDVVYRRFP